YKLTSNFKSFNGSIIHVTCIYNSFFNEFRIEISKLFKLLLITYYFKSMLLIYFNYIYKNCFFKIFSIFKSIIEMNIYSFFIAEFSLTFNPYITIKPRIIWITKSHVLSNRNQII